MLNWTGGNVRLRRPIAIDVTTNMLGPGVDLNGAKIIADFDDPRQNAITIRIPAAASKVSLRGMKFCNGVIIAGSPAQDAITLICATNQSWIYSWKFMNLDVGGFARDGLSFNGSVFEGECHAVTCADNGRNGMTFRNDGPRDDLGIVSAVSIFGGQLRTNGNAGIETQSVIPYEEPRDLNISQTYFVENKGPGLHATAGLSMAMGCGFENNGECGIKLMNEGRLYACRASTYGSQPYLVEAYLNDGDLLLDGCRVEGYSGFENKMKLAKISGKGPGEHEVLGRSLEPRPFRQHRRQDDVAARIEWTAIYVRARLACDNRRLFGRSSFSNWSQRIWQCDGTKRNDLTTGSDKSREEKALHHSSTNAAYLATKATAFRCRQVVGRGLCA